MKKHILTTTLLLAAFATLAQKKTYQPDLTKKVTLQVEVNTLDLNNFMYVLQLGGPEAVSKSTTLTGDKITYYLKGYAAVIDSLNNVPGKAWLQFYKQGEAKWVADTLKAFNFKKKP